MTNFIGSGGGGGDAPVNTPDSLFSEDIVEFALAISEGPIRGLQHGAKSFSVGDTPLVALDGITKNFEKFAIGVHPGYPEGGASPLKLILGGTSSNESVGVVLVKDTPVIRQTASILRDQIDEIEVRIMFNRMIYSDNSGTFKTTAKFNIEYKTSSEETWHDFYPDHLIQVKGKTSSGYVREFRVTVPRLANDDWMIRVTKISPDHGTYNMIDMSWDSFQATTKGEAVYPDTAVVHGIGVANGQFSSVPDFSGVYDLMEISVPTNYNADLRTYDESTPWNGTFKLSWTNNPAWVLYDLITNPRYGVAAYRPYVNTDRYTFYAAAKWCDQMVGTPQRPRYTFNDLIQDPRPASELLAYVAGSFNAFTLDDNNGTVHLIVDYDSPAVMLFTPENVTDNQTGGFEYSYTDLTSRANDVTVSFVNPDLDWNEDKRRIPNVTTNEAHITKYGRIPLEFIAVGCTNAEEAIHKAAVRMTSALTETTMVSFTTTQLGSLINLYSVILIADPTMGWSLPGRIKSHGAGYVNFRDPIYIETIQPYTMKVQTTTGIVDISVQPDEIGHVYRLQLLSAMPDPLPAYASFTLEQTGTGFGIAKPFRVLGVEEAGESNGQLYRINAIEINRNKYLDADNLMAFPEYTYSYAEPALSYPPTEFRLESGDTTILVMPSGEVVSRILASWRRPSTGRISGFEVQYKKEDDIAWSELIFTHSEEMYISPVVAETSYNVRVRSVGALVGGNSNWVTASSHVVLKKVKVPNNVQNLVATQGLFQNTLTWTLPGDYDLSKVEVWGGVTDVLADMVKLSDVSLPATTWTHLGLGINVLLYYQVRTQDTSSNYSLWSTVVSARTINDPALILEILQGQITASSLDATLNTSIEAIDGAVQQLEEVSLVVDGVSAQHYIKTDVNGLVSGYGLYSTPESSAFIVKASNFAFGFPGAVTKYPFIIGMVQGVSTIGINGELVVDGSITADSIDTRGLTIKDMLGNVIFSSGVPLDYLNVANGPPAGATVGAEIGVNVAGQITAENASTFIADAAIGNAHIAALSADKITTGTLAATASITVGAPDTGIVIDAATSSLTVKKAGSWVYYAFIEYGTKPTTPPNATAESLLPVGWSDYPLDTWVVGNIWYVACTVSATGTPGSWFSPGVQNSMGESGITYATKRFGKSMDRVSSPTTWTDAPPALTGSEVLWMKHYKVSYGGAVGDWSSPSYAPSYRLGSPVSGETALTAGVFNTLTVGKLALPEGETIPTFGLSGLDSSKVEVFRLDDDGLYIKPSSQSLWSFGAAYGWETIAEGFLQQFYDVAGTTGTGMVTTYIPLFTAAELTTLWGTACSLKIFTEVVGTRTLYTASTGVYANSAYSRTFVTQFYTPNRTTTTSMSDVTITSDTTDGTNFAAASRCSLLYDSTGATAGSAGIFLKLVSRNMNDYENPLYNDMTEHKYIVRAIKMTY